uniref:GT23 domain-containing protein n=1 Tax=Plectus sambesii TaxID=2011161 RepID=A0A914WG70_9BILA
MVVLLFLLPGDRSDESRVDDGEVREIFSRRVDDVLEEVEQLRKQNEQLRKLLLENSKSIEQGLQEMEYTLNVQIPTPSRTEQAFEERMDQLRRQERTIQAALENLFFLYKDHVPTISNVSSTQGQISAADKKQNEAVEMFQYLLARTQQLTINDESRKQKLRNLTKMVETRLHNLQHPQECEGRKKLICKLEKSCGFACQIHHVIYCLIVAYATNRTMLLDDKTWRYSDDGWTSVFQPVSSCKISAHEARSAKRWTGKADVTSASVIHIPIVDVLEQQMPYLPQSIPADLASDLISVHSYPPAWWIGQFAQYLMRPSDDLLLHLNAEEKRLVLANWRPLVGVHVRRTDKVPSEAAEHALSEYMTWVDHYFNVQRFNYPQLAYKPVYLATDDGPVIEEAYDKYSTNGYVMMANEKIAASARLDTRYNEKSLYGIITDIHILSKTNYLVCTFSSQVCRLAYELMQARSFEDKGMNFHSLDDIYYYGGQLGRELTVVEAHSAQRPAEIDLKEGDVVKYEANLQNGYSIGRNARTNRRGQFPSFKTIDKWRIVEF